MWVSTLPLSYTHSTWCFPFKNIFLTASFSHLHFSKNSSLFAFFLTPT
jgi:hypothetical protein